MSQTVLTAEGKDKVIEELEFIVSTLLPQVEDKIQYGEDNGHNITELIEQQDFYKKRITYLENMITTARVIGDMKYYKVSDPYYAIIKARTQKEAIRIYEQHISDDEDNELRENMIEVSRDYALVHFSRSTGEDMKLLKPQELLEEFNDDISGVLVVTSEIL